VANISVSAVVSRVRFLVLPFAMAQLVENSTLGKRSRTDPCEKSTSAALNQISISVVRPERRFSCKLEKVVETADEFW
jgi:hypothetical protein